MGQKEWKGLNHVVSVNHGKYLIFPLCNGKSLIFQKVNNVIQFILVVITLVAKLEWTGKEARMKEKGQLEVSCSVPKRLLMA